MFLCIVHSHLIFSLIAHLFLKQLHVCLSVLSANITVFFSMFATNAPEIQTAATAYTEHRGNHSLKLHQAMEHVSLLKTELLCVGEYMGYF